MKNKYIFIFYIFFNIIYFINNNNIPFNKTIYQWAKKNNISISSKIYLNYTSNNNKNFYSNDTIKENETLITIPKNILITSDNMYNLLKDDSPILKQIYNDLLLNETSESHKIFRTKSTREQVFITLSFNYLFSHKRNKIYKLYKRYFNTFQDNLDNFPLLYTNEELNILSPTRFGFVVYQAKKSIDEEYDYLTKKLNYDNLILDNYIKYRILTVSKSYEVFNTSSIVPLLDYFKLEINNNYSNVYWNITEDGVKLYATKNIESNKKLLMKCAIEPNSRYLLFYGVTFKDNFYLEPFVVNLFHSKFRKELDERKILFKGEVNNFDLTKNDFIGITINDYRTLGHYYNLPANDDTGYKFLLKNLKYYREEYDKILDKYYYELILSNENRINIKRVIDLEIELLDKRISLLTEIVTDREKRNKNKNKTSDL